MGGFEPPTSWPPSRRATKLRHIPPPAILTAALPFVKSLPPAGPAPLPPLGLEPCALDEPGAAA